jgi:hypothetical protein
VWGEVRFEGGMAIKNTSAILGEVPDAGDYHWQ